MAEITQTNSLIPNGVTFTGTFRADPNTFINRDSGPSYALVGVQTLNSDAIEPLSAIATSGGIRVQDNWVVREGSDPVDKLAPEAGFIRAGYRHHDDCPPKCEVLVCCLEAFSYRSTQMLTDI